MEGPCYGRVNFWGSSLNASYDTKLQNEMDYMEQVGCNGYMIELCAHTAANESQRWGNDPYSSGWFNEVEEKYNKFLDLIKKHKKMWALVSMFNGNSWKRKVGPSDSNVDKIIDIVKKAGHSDMICILPVGEPQSQYPQAAAAIQKVHRELGGFKLLKSNFGDTSQNYWNWYSAAMDGPPSNKKLYESSDNAGVIQNLVGYDSAEHEWVPEFPELFDLEETGEESEKARYDYRAVVGRTVNWVRNKVKIKNTATAAYYAWGYDGNNDGTEGGDSHCEHGIDVFAICAEVVGHDLSIPDGYDVLKNKVEELYEANGRDVHLY